MNALEKEAVRQMFESCHPETAEMILNRHKEMFSSLDTQIGGTHYKDMAIQPLEFFIANETPFAEASVCKYVLRHNKKGGKQDLEKAKHVIDVLIEKYYGGNNG